MKSNVRTFIAVELSGPTRRATEDLIKKFRSVPVDVKWVDAEQMHITLKFLGDVPVREIPRVCDLVQKAVAGVAPFEFEVCGAGAFPHLGRPRTVWLGAGSGEAEMVDLQERVENALVKLGFGKERRRFQPHLTLGRVRRGGPGMNALADALREQADFIAGRSPINQVIVFASELQSSGPVYSVMGRARLQGKGHEDS